MSRPATKDERERERVGIPTSLDCRLSCVDSTQSSLAPSPLEAVDLTRGESGFFSLTSAARSSWKLLRNIMTSAPSSYGIQLTWLEHLALRSIANGVTQTAAAPFETVKLRQQLRVMDINVANGALRRIAVDEGPAALFRVAPYGALRFFTKGLVDAALKEQTNHVMRSILVRENSARASKAVMMLASVVAGTCLWTLHAALTYPIDAALALAVVERRGASAGALVRDGAQVTFARQLPAHVVGMCGIATYRAAHIVLVNAAKQRGLLSPRLSLLRKWLTNFAIASATELCAFPFDTIRRRMLLADALESGDRTAEESALAASTRESLYSDLFRGALANALRVLVTTALFTDTESLIESAHCRLFYPEAVFRWFERRSRDRRRRRGQDSTVTPPRASPARPTDNLPLVEDKNGRLSGGA